MIDLKQVTDADIGRSVKYIPTDEVGVLTSYNKHYLFVRFNGPNGEACVPADTAWEHNSDTNQ